MSKKLAIGLSVIVLAVASFLAFCPLADTNSPEAQKFFGYTPQPDETAKFVASLPTPTIKDADPNLFKGGKVDTFLYRSLYKAHKHKFGTDWKVGSQGIGDCFVAGTLVTMGDGRQKPIEVVKVGDIVRSHTMQWQKVVRTIKKQSDSKLVTLKSKGYQEVTATADHRFIADYNDNWAWRAAETIWVGDKLLTICDHPVRGPPATKWSEVEVATIAQPATPTTVYCLEVENDHSFFANGYAVHNCVSWGWAHAVDIHTAVLWDHGAISDWKPAATESIYGGSRVEARGVSFGGWSDGSYGGAAAKWVRDWGIIYREKYDGHDFTVYSSSTAKNFGAWGNGGKDDNGKLDAEAKKFPITDVTLVRNFEEAAAAIQSGYPVPVCSGQGFSSQRDSQGFCRPQGSWAHCMCFIGVRYGDRPGLLCLNSWGPRAQSGTKFPEDMPDGSFWVDAEVCTRMLRGGDSFAVSGFVGFPHRDLSHGDWVDAAPKHSFDESEPLYALAP